MKPNMYQHLRKMEQQQQNHKIRFNPVTIILAYIALHVILTIAIAVIFLPKCTGCLEEFLAASFGALSDGMLVTTIITTIIYRKWTIKYWYISAFLYIISSYSYIIYFIMKLTIKDWHPTFWWDRFF
jgi:hypothetical protein